MRKHTRRLATALSLIAASVCAPAEAAWKPDLSFGPNGVRLLAPLPGASQSLVASATDAQGRMVAVGTMIQGGQRDILAMRFLTDGSPDPSFGFDGSVAIDGGEADEAALALAVQADGSVVIAGSRGRGAMLMRLTPAGALDLGFGTNGVSIPAFMTGSGARLVDVALDSQGRAVALGTVYGDGGAAKVNAFVMRTLADGSLDRGFDLDGVRILREFEALASALVVEAGDRMVLVGYFGQEYRLAALTAVGSLDLGFGQGGTSKSVIGAGAIASDLVAWRNSYIVSGVNVAPLVRFDAAGVRDLGFGVNGVAKDAAPVEAWTLAALPDGSLGVGGSCRGGAGAGWYVGALAVDASALTSVTCEVVPNGSTVAVVRALRPSSTRLVAVGHRFDSSGARSALLRYAPQAPTSAPVAAVDPRCTKPVFKRMNPVLCAAPAVVNTAPPVVTPTPTPVAVPVPVASPTPIATPTTTAIHPKCVIRAFRLKNPALCS